MQESRFWWAFSCWSCNPLTMVLINSKWREEILASTSSTSHSSLENIILWNLQATLFRNFKIFNVILKREVKKLFKHATFYVIMTHIWTFSNDKLLVVLHAREHKALYLTSKVLKFSKDGIHHGNEILLTYGINKEHNLVTNRFLVSLN